METTPLYKVWIVYEPGRFKYIKYCVVNTKHRRVQSSWNTYLEATKVAMDLNNRSDYETSI